MAEFEQAINTKVEFWMLEIADTENYYNARHQIIRVTHGGGYYDIKCSPGHIVPNQKDHLVICILPENYFNRIDGLSEEELNYPPGTLSKAGGMSRISQGIALLTPKRQTLSTSNPQSAGGSFAMSDVNMFDMDNVCVAVTPPLPGRDYTTLDDQNSGDVNNESVGLFINKQGTILIKSVNGSITLGKEGVHVGGKFKADASVKDTGFLTENPLSKIIPSTIPTAWASAPIPNMGAIASITNASMKYIEATDKAVKITSIISNFPV
jgi:hypothetical protein